MLNVMRKHAGSWMIKVILFAIVIVFVFWGVGSFRSQQASKVAAVNDEIIGVTEYRRAYNNLIDQYRQRFGSSLNDGMIEMLQLKKQALDQLIDRTILLQEAEKLGLRVSDAEVADSITDIPVFQNDGSFDSNRYRSILAQVHLTPEEFEADQKNSLLVEKLARVIQGAAKVSEAEARQWYDWQNTSVNVDYVWFDPTRYEDVKPTAEEIAAYFDSHKEAYKTESMVKARYVAFDPQTYKNQVKADETEAKAYYDSNIAEFKTEKSVEARHILIKLDPGAAADADLAAKSKAEEIAKKAKAGEDFAELAKTYSEDPAKDRGGYLGKFRHSQMVKPFADKAFSMAAGEIGDPVKTQFGWHVIKVESVEEASTQTFEQSRQRITDSLADQKAKSLAYDKAEQFYESTFDKDQLVDNAKSFDLALKETAAFSRRGPDALGADKEAFAQAAFDLKVDEISDIKEIGGRYYIIQLTETIEAVIPQLEAVKSRVEADLAKTMRSDKAREQAETMAAELTAGKTLEESAGNLDLTVKQTGLFARNAEIPTIGADAQFSEAAFQLVSIGSTSSQPVQGNQGFYLLRLAERKAPAADDFKTEADNIERMLVQQKQRILFQNWIDARKSDSRISIENAFLE